MKIKTQLILTTVIFGAMLAIIAGSVIITNQRVEQANAEKTIARNLEQQAIDLSYLSSAYLLYGESQQLRRWELRYASFLKTLARLDTGSPEQRAGVAALKTNHERLKKVFDDGGASDWGSIQISWSRAQVQNQGLIFDSGRLEHMLSDRTNGLKQTNTLLIFILIGAFGAFLSVNFFLTYRRILSSIALLHEGAKVIGSGDLDFRISEKSNDEIGELSRAFNQMTADLKDVTASKAELADSEERFYSLVDTATDAIVCADESGKIVLWNEAAAKIFGYTSKEVMGKTIGRLIPKRWRRAHEKGLKNFISTGEAKVLGRTVELAGLTKEGHEFPLELSLSSWTQSGRVFFTAIMHDITERKLSQAALAEERERLAVTLGSIGDGVIATDADGNVVLLNGVAEQLTGWAPNEAIGKPLSEVFKIVNEKTGKRAPDPVAKALRTGTIVGLANHTALIAKDGTERSIADSCAPIRAVDGSLVGAVLVFRDVSEEYEAEKLRDAHNEINAAIGSTLDFDAIMQTVVVRAAEAVGCDTTSIEMRREDCWEVCFQYGLSPDIIGTRFRFEETTGLELVVKRREPFNVNAMMLAPIIIKGEVVAALRFVDRSASVPFSGAQVDFARKLAASVSLALENARLYAVEHHIAQTLQEALLSVPQALPGIEFSHLYRSATEAAKVGGDFYGVFQIEPGQIGIFMGDVAGKGVSAATLTVLVEHTIKAFAYQGYSPAEILAKTNDVLERETEDNMFVSLFLGVIDTGTGALTYCDAGHPPPVLKRRTGHTELLTTVYPVLGVFTGPSYVEHGVSLKPGDSLILYTDGIIEARRPDGAFFGEARLLEAVVGSERATELAERIFADVNEFTTGNLADDLAILSVSLVDNKNRGVKPSTASV